MRLVQSVPSLILVAGFSFAPLGGCGGPSIRPDAGATGKDAGPDAGGGGSDGGTGAGDAGTDGGADAGGCTLGTADHCGTCGTSCPGVDDVGTSRVCLSGTACDIYCKGEHYDVDTQVDSGCEAEDLPVQDTLATAAPVGLPAYAAGGTGAELCDGSTNPCTVGGQTYGDARVHDSAPQFRALGRDDWFKVTASSTASPNNVLKSCLWIGNFPVDNSFSLCVSEAGGQSVDTCANVTGGGSSACVQPAGGADVGIFYVRVQRLAGSITPNHYALYLEH